MPKESETSAPVDEPVDEESANSNSREWLTEKAAAVRQADLRRQEMVKAVEETESGRINWQRVKWILLGALLCLLVGFFLSTAFWDRVNFMQGARILLGWAKQILVMAALFLAFRWWRKRHLKE